MQKRFGGGTHALFRREEVVWTVLVGVLGEEISGWREEAKRRRLYGENVTEKRLYAFVGLAVITT